MAPTGPVGLTIPRKRGYARGDGASLPLQRQPLRTSLRAELELSGLEARPQLDPRLITMRLLKMAPWARRRHSAVAAATLKD